MKERKQAMPSEYDPEEVKKARKGEKEGKNAPLHLKT